MRKTVFCIHVSLDGILKKKLFHSNSADLKRKEDISQKYIQDVVQLINEPKRH